MMTLRPFEPGDSAHLLRWVHSRKDLVQWSGPSLFRHPLDRRQLLDYHARAQGTLSTSRIFTAVDNASGAPIGHCELSQINREQKTGTVCRVLLDPARRGEGLCSRMMVRLLDTGFAEMNLRRIDLRVYAFNDSAIRCYRQAGFTHEGRLRQAVEVDGAFWDVVLMGILREEWACT